jgi:hypothetical protein
VSPEHRSQWFIYGHYFGYPQCCITSFCALRHLGRKNTVQMDVADNTGFVPCIRCAKRVKAGKIKLVDLIQNRVSTCQFPTDDDEKDLEGIMEWLASMKIDGEKAAE